MVSLAWSGFRRRWIATHTSVAIPFYYFPFSMPTSFPSQSVGQTHKQNLSSRCKFCNSPFKTKILFLVKFVLKISDRNKNFRTAKALCVLFINIMTILTLNTHYKENIKVWMWTWSEPPPPTTHTHRCIHLLYTSIKFGHQRMQVSSLTVGRRQLKNSCHI